MACKNSLAESWRQDAEHKAARVEREASIAAVPFPGAPIPAEVNGCAVVAGVLTDGGRTHVLLCDRGVQWGRSRWVTCLRGSQAAAREGWYWGHYSTSKREAWEDFLTRAIQCQEQDRLRNVTAWGPQDDGE